MAELIDKGVLLADFNNGGIHIEFDLPVEEILGEDVDIDDFSMLVQDAIQAYRKMVIDTIQKQPTTTEAEIRAKVIEEFAEKLRKRIKVEKKAQMFLDETDLFDEEQIVSFVAEIAEQLKERE